MTVKNLWGELPVGDKIRTPAVILKEQAALLGQMTNNVLEGRVRKKNTAKGFEAHFDIVAPTLDNYAYTLFIVTYGPSFYPVDILDLTWSGPREFRIPRVCRSEEGFEQALSEILSSDAVRKIIIGLLSEIEANA